MDIKPITMKKFLVVLSFLAIGAFVPILPVKACAGNVNHCNELARVIADATQNCLCGSEFTATDVCGGGEVTITVSC